VRICVRLLPDLLIYFHCDLFLGAVIGALSAHVIFLRSQQLTHTRKAPIPSEALQENEIPSKRSGI